MGKMVKLLGIVIVASALSGCLSAGTNARLCSDLGVIGKIANAVNSKLGSAVAEYAPKKCLNGGISGDAGNLTGGINLGVTSEASESNPGANPSPLPVE